MTKNINKKLDKNSTSIKPRPWIRLWSRVFDLIFVISFLGILIGFLFPGLANMDDTKLGFLMLSFWVFGEAFCISKFRTTPGRTLFKISLTHKSGKPINFSDALNRTWLVIFRGLAIYLPVIYIISGCIAYRNLMKYGKTSWDKDGGYIISHQKIGVDRVIVLLGIFGIFSYVIYLGNL